VSVALGLGRRLARRFGVFRKGLVVEHADALFLTLLRFIRLESQALVNFCGIEGYKPVKGDKADDRVEELETVFFGVVVIGAGLNVNVHYRE